MKKIFYCVILISSILSVNAQEKPPASPPAPTKVSDDEPKENNITGGLFIGFSYGGDLIYDDVKLPNNLYTYNVKDKKPNYLDSFNPDGIGFEARLGLIKTFKNIGLRAYAYYGKSWLSYESLGFNERISSLIVGTDDFIQTGYLDVQYYGGIIDLMLGAFQSKGFSAYFTLGGGYQYTNYTSAGTFSVGDKNNDATSIFSGKTVTDIYSGRNKASVVEYASPVVSLGLGAISGKHHMLEANMRYIINTPTIDAYTTVAYEGTAYKGIDLTTTHTKRYNDDEHIMIQNNIMIHLNFMLSYSYIF
ncbi:hypothetical protein [Helicobacter sp. 13S00477-4]|uniref:hypothetical protein n=1 Tax=Helicobacter sp. 13S00477-4 TaxID=1905759 RepID=UPI000BA6D27E|nr:hypothetical protein [Helicobacter sp. 13S00477-4]PAF52501.1 hypothetical protein BKH44_01595 [Helicobacter sp. 13S00477-4]